MDTWLEDCVWLPVGAPLGLCVGEAAWVPLPVCVGLPVSICEGDDPRLRVCEGVVAWLIDCEAVWLDEGEDVCEGDLVGLGVDVELRVDAWLDVDVDVDDGDWLELADWDGVRVGVRPCSSDRVESRKQNVEKRNTSTMDIILR